MTKLKSMQVKEHTVLNRKLCVCLALVVQSGSDDEGEESDIVEQNKDKEKGVFEDIKADRK